MQHNKEDKKRFLQVLEAKNLNVKKACKAFGIERSTFYRWKNEQWFIDALDDLWQGELDDAEDTLRMLRKGVPKRDQEGNIIGWIVRPSEMLNKFFLETKGKERGYIQKVTVENEFTEPLEVVIRKRNDDQ